MKDKGTPSIATIERAIDDFVYEHWLDPGERLPSLQDLTMELKCGKESLLQALQSAQQNNKLSCQDDLWYVTAQESKGPSFSFTASASGRQLTTDLIEAAIRSPMDDQLHTSYQVERRVHDALRLEAGSPFIVIRRLRLIDGHPGAFQDVYLNPSFFPNDFVTRHNFQSESLIKIYESYGYHPRSRDTRLVARFANIYEINTLRKYGDLDTRAVLDAEQRLYGDSPGDDKPSMVIEFMKASYLDNWRYQIKGRPAAGTA